jgi:hypothetical protein
MNCNLYCLIDAAGQVYVKDGARSHSEVAANFGLNAQLCDSYRFDLAVRHVWVDHGRPASERVAHAYWDQRVGSPEKLMTFAAEGRLTKHVLKTLLGRVDAATYLEACTATEEQKTADCAPNDAPCLESREGVEYHSACAAIWRTLFEDPRRRIKIWMH